MGNREGWWEGDSWVGRGGLEDELRGGVEVGEVRAELEAMVGEESGVDGGVEVAWGISDEPGALGVEVEFAECGADHSAGGFSPGVFACVGSGRGVWVEGAVVEGVDDSRWEELSESVVDGFDATGADGAACDGALVGDDDERVAGVGERVAGVCGAGEELDPFRIDEVARVGGRGWGGKLSGVDEGVVAVEEDGGPHGGS
jgi:hypothetical protein